MDIPLAIFGAVMIGVGVIFIKVYINWNRKGEKDTFGSETRLLVAGIGFIPIGIIIIVKAFGG